MIRVGLLVPASNLTIEYEFNKMLNFFKLNDVLCFHISRIDFNTRFSESKNQYFKELILNTKPAINNLKKICDYYAFCCTSAELFFRKNQSIFTEDIKSIFNDKNVVFPLESIKKQLKNYNNEKIGIFSPYDEFETKEILDFLNFEKKLNIVTNNSFNLKSGKEYFDFGNNELPNIVKSDSKNIDIAIVLCTNFPSVRLMINKNFKLISSNLSLFKNILKKFNIYL
ncbi:MAG TPA: hypothetical protein VLL98_03200 [Rickettsiales bacterium]|nr:hypothetical protein [Rickettsiales bacterium]